MNASEKSVKKVEVRAPMSGVFYTKPSPDEPAYVAVGDTVKKKQVLALLETMKVFQKVKCPANGRVVEIIAEDETPLKDNDLMFVIEKVQIVDNQILCRSARGDKKRKKCFTHAKPQS